MLITYDVTQIQHTNLGTFDNDAKACYDRIINGIAMMAACCLGMPTPAVATHVGVLVAMEKSLKTTFGISSRLIHGTSAIPIF